MPDPDERTPDLDSDYPPEGRRIDRGTLAILAAMFFLAIVAAGLVLTILLR